VQLLRILGEREGTVDVAIVGIDTHGRDPAPDVCVDRGQRTDAERDQDERLGELERTDQRDDAVSAHTLRSEQDACAPTVSAAVRC
jgi:hypothetical protein